MTTAMWVLVIGPAIATAIYLAALAIDAWAGCLRPQCRRCDGVAGDEVLCWSCYQIEDSETA